MTFSEALFLAARDNIKITCPGWNVEYFYVDEHDRMLYYWNGNESEYVEAYYLILWMEGNDWEIKDDM